MKSARLLIFLLMACASAQAAKKDAKDSFTAWSETPSEAWFGILKTESGYEPEARLAHYEFATKSKKSIALPSELQGREVIRVFSSEEGALVVTQLRVEQGDKPQVSFYSKKDGSWKQLGEIACEAPVKIEAESQALNTTCERGTERAVLRFALKQQKLNTSAKSARPIPSVEELSVGQDKKTLRLEAHAL